MRVNLFASSAWFPLAAALALGVLVQAVPARAQETVLAEQRPEHTPRGALWRAAALPGWGQVYNRQYYKLPIVYLGLGGLTAAVLYTNDRYLLYRNAHRYKISQDRVESGQIDENPFPQHEDEYLQLVEQVGGQEISARFLQSEREKFQRYRDLSAIGVGVFYALTILDAYVSAHLLHFDVSEDLSLRFYPQEHGVGAALYVYF